MKYDYLKKNSVKERQNMLAPDWNKKYFQGCHLFSVLLIIAVTTINGIFAVLYGKSLFVVCFCDFIGIPLAIIAHLSTFSGFISCNTGSYFRDTEPTRFWFTTGFPLFGYVFSQLAIWYL